MKIWLKFKIMMEKQNILWEAFKKRMRQSNTPSMHFNLHDFYGEGMEPEISAGLEEPFTDKEIDEIIKELPNDKS
jgi:hypothetical protein